MGRRKQLIVFRQAYVAAWYVAQDHRPPWELPQHFVVPVEVVETGRYILAVLFTML